MTLGIGLIVLRVALGLLLVGHGCQKLFGWFRGHGLTGTGTFFESLGYRPGARYALLAGACEIVGGALLGLGLFTPVGAAVALGVMLVAASVHTANGLWATDGGYELPAFYAVAAAALAYTGPGRYSLDHVLGYTWGWRYGVAAVVVGVLAASVATAVRMRGSKPLSARRRRGTDTRRPAAA